MRNPPETISPETFYSANLGKTVDTSKGMTSSCDEARPECRSPEKMMSHMKSMLGKSCDAKECVSD